MQTAAEDLASTVASIQAHDDGFPIFAALKGTALALLVLWTIVANSLVFIVLYKNPRLQTVPNLLVSIIYIFLLKCNFSSLSF